MIKNQRITFYKDKVSARHGFDIWRTINRAIYRDAGMMDSMRREAKLSQISRVEEYSEAQLRDMLLTPAQVQAVEVEQKLCRQMLDAMRVANQQAVVFGLDLPRLQLSEVVTYLMALDEKIRNARWAAKKLGVRAVSDKFERVMPFEKRKVA